MGAEGALPRTLPGVLRRLVASQTARIRSEEALVRRGEDPEGVHRMRVATRRLRAALSAFRPVLVAGPERRLGAALRRLADALGPVRDLDVLLGELPTALAGVGLVEAPSVVGHLEEERRQARRRLLAFLDGKAWPRLLGNLDAWVAAPPVLTRRRPAESVAPTTSVPEAARLLVQERLERVRRQGRRCRKRPDETRLHRLRVACKRLRYLVEFFRPALPEALGALHERAVALQDLLGAANDAAVAARRLSEAPDMVVAWYEARADELRGQFPAAWAGFRQLARESSRSLAAPRATA